MERQLEESNARWDEERRTINHRADRGQQGQRREHSHDITCIYQQSWNVKLDYSDCNIPLLYKLGEYKKSFSSSHKMDLFTKHIRFDARSNITVLSVFTSSYLSRVDFVEKHQSRSKWLNLVRRVNNKLVFSIFLSVTNIINPPTHPLVNLLDIFLLTDLTQRFTSSQTVPPDKVFQVQCMSESSFRLLLILFTLLLTNGAVWSLYL